MLHGISVGSWNTKPSCGAAARQSIVAARRSGQAGQQPQHRRFAAAGGAEQRQELALAHVEIEAGERGDAVGEDFVDAAQGDERAPLGAAPERRAG